VCLFGLRVQFSYPNGGIMSSPSAIETVETNHSFFLLIHTVDFTWLVLSQ